MSEMTPRAILEKHTWEGSLWIADDLRPAQAVAKDLYAALAQEIADHEVDRARIEALFEHRRVFQCERTVLKCKTCDELIAALTAKEKEKP